MGLNLAVVANVQGGSKSKPLYYDTAPATTGGAAPYRKIAPHWVTVWEDLSPVLHMHTLLKRSYSTRTTMKRTNFPRRFDKTGLELSESFTHRVTATQLCSTSMPVDFCRHLVGKTLRNVCHCDSTQTRLVGKSVITWTFS